eukprot:scaffold48644_cov32-Phaeocystis_antarctica.AAC.2
MPVALHVPVAPPVSMQAFFGRLSRLPWPWPAPQHAPGPLAAHLPLATRARAFSGRGCRLSWPRLAWHAAPPAACPWPAA